MKIQPAMLALLLSMVSPLAGAMDIGSLEPHSYYGGSFRFCPSNGSALLGYYNFLSLSPEGIVFARVNHGDGGDGSPSYRYLSAATGNELAFPALAGSEVIKAGPFRSGRARVLLHDAEALYGYLDTAGKWAIPPRFLDADDFVDGYASVIDIDGKVLVIDATGKVALRLEKERLKDLCGGFALLESPEGSYAFDLKAGKKSGPELLHGFQRIPDSIRDRVGGAKFAFFVEQTKGVFYESMSSLVLPDGRSLAEAFGIKGSPFASASCELRGEYIRFSPAFSGRDTYGALPYRGNLVPMPAELAQADETPEFLPGGYWALRSRARSYLRHRDDEGYDERMAGKTPGSTTSLYAADGKLLGKDLFSYVQESDGSLVHVLFGNYSGNSVSGNSGCLHGLFDVKTMKFAVEPKKAAIAKVEGTSRWILRDFDGSCSLYDQAKGAVLGAKLPDMALRMEGSVVFADYESGSHSPFDGLMAWVSTDKVNLRTGPSSTAAVLDVLDAGTFIRVMEISPALKTVGPYTGFWAKIACVDDHGQKTQEGWILSPFIEYYGYPDEL